MRNGNMYERAHRMVEIELIVSQYSSAEDGSVKGAVLRYMHMYHHDHSTRAVEELHVRNLGRPYIRKGFSVIVRPRYNSPGSMDFYEWQSLDGEDFKRVDFKSSRSRERLIG